MEKQGIIVEKLNFTYEGCLTPTLIDINFQAKPREFITITGASGCGKSTLALCLAGFIPHNVSGILEGNIFINGMSTRIFPPAKLAGNVGLVQQDPETQLCTLKVVDEVAFGPENLCLPPDEIRKRVDWALEAVDCHHLINREVYSLSGGEKQRIAIASILAMQPSVLILDEPTANLDPVSMGEVLQVIEHLRQEKEMTVIIIEHRLKHLLSLSDRLIVMDNGRIVEDYKPQSRSYHADLYALKNREEKLSPKKSKEPIYNEQALLKIDRVTVNYGKKTVLKDISFELRPNEVTAIMGDNGSGKTSLLLALLGINKVTSGKVFYRGQDITKMKVAHRAKIMGLIFQNPNHQIFEHTVFREAYLSASLLRKGENNKETIERLLDTFGLLQYRNNVPFALSLGEKKRLTLASILAYQPAILVLDEPLVGQDEYRLGLFWDAVAAHSRGGGSTLMVCHEPDFVEAFCDRIIFLSEGRVLVDAPVNEAFMRLEKLGFKEYLPAKIRWGEGVS